MWCAAGAAEVERQSVVADTARSKSWLTGAGDVLQCANGWERRNFRSVTRQSGPETTASRHADQNVNISVAVPIAGAETCLAACAEGTVEPDGPAEAIE